jgi:hypothetical protein
MSLSIHWLDHEHRYDVAHRHPRFRSLRLEVFRTLQSAAKSLQIRGA